jgi:hypothetical protein
MNQKLMTQQLNKSENFNLTFVTLLISIFLSQQLILNSLRTEGFFRKIQKMHLFPENGRIGKLMGHQKVLLELS